MLTKLTSLWDTEKSILICLDSKSMYMQCYCEYVYIELCEYRMVATLTKNETKTK